MKRKRRSRLGMPHAQNDARYVATGRALALVTSPDAGAELRRMNRGKNGRPYKYPESLIMTLAGFRSYCRLSFRVCEGFAGGQLGGESVPHFTQIWRRMNALDVSVGARAVSVRGRNGVLNLSIDGTGMSPSGRSEYIRFRHRVEHGFIRFVMVVDTDTREILSFSITDETTGEAPQFRDLTLEALENAGVGAGAAGRVGRGRGPGPGATPRGGGPEIVMRADGGFDSRPIFAFCDRLGIIPYIRVGISSATRSRGVNRARTRAVLDQLGGGMRDPREFAELTRDEKEANRKKWKKRVGYGKRWLVEIVISSFKRLFGDSVRAVRWKYIAREMTLKVNLYNMMLRVQREAMAVT